MIHDKHCFELYGYDLIIDSDLRPWLLEVNASPSLSANTNEDYAMKTEMLHGMLDIVDMDKVLLSVFPLSPPMFISVGSLWRRRACVGMGFGL
jgi:hypothetical protein